MTVVSRAFGLVLRSDIPLPGVPVETRPPPDRSAPPLRIHLHPPGSTPLPFERPNPWPPVDPSGLQVHAGDDGSILIGYADGTIFLLSPDGSELRMGWEPPLTLEDATTYLLGPILAVVLRLRGTLSLHAGVLAGRSPDREPVAMALAGEAGAGKSTLTAALALRGWEVLTDDVAPLRPEGSTVQVTPGIPRIRIWPDSTERLFGTVDALPALTPTWEKQALDLGGERAHLFRAHPTPLGAILLLGEGDPDTVRRLTPREAFVAVLGNIHTARILPDQFQEDGFRWAEALAASVPTLALPPSPGLERLDDLVGLVEDAAESLGIHPPSSPADRHV